MSAFLGASPQELESLANVFLGFSQTLDTRRREINTRLHTAGWEGDHADQFRAEWNSKHYPLLTNLVAALVSAATTLRYEAHQQDVASGVSSSSASSGGLLGDIERDVSAVAAGIAGMARGVLGSGERALQHVEQVLEGDKKPAKPPATTKPSESAAQIAPAAVAAGAAATVTTIQSIAIGQANAPPVNPGEAYDPSGLFAADYATGNPEWCGAFAAWVLGQKGWANAADSKWGSVASWYTAAQNNQDGLSLVTPPALPQPGDLVIYAGPDGAAGLSIPGHGHIGIVTATGPPNIPQTQQLAPDPGEPSGYTGRFDAVQGNFTAVRGQPPSVYETGPGTQPDASSAFGYPDHNFFPDTDPGQGRVFFVRVQPSAAAG